jgi:hypothetical protein
MVTLDNDVLTMAFPEVHKDAVLRISLMRTLRIPDNAETHRLPPGLGRFPLRHVDDFQDKAPESWRAHGGIMLPMYQAEALWLNFESTYPMAVKIATGKINAVTGKEWTNDLAENPQDYVIVPGQRWLDGYCTSKGIIRQFVAMPLGSGYTAEEQVTGKAEHGGLQIIAFPLRAELWEEILRERAANRRSSHGILRGGGIVYENVPYFGNPNTTSVQYLNCSSSFTSSMSRKLSAIEPASAMFADMGLAPGGKMEQEIVADTRKVTSYDQSHKARCFIHLTNSLVWRAITGQAPPQTPVTAAEYTKNGLPWFDYYDESATAIDGSQTLAGLKSVAELAAEKNQVVLPENEAIGPAVVKTLKDKRPKNVVREGIF